MDDTGGKSRVAQVAAGAGDSAPSSPLKKAFAKSSSALTASSTSSYTGRGSGESGPAVASPFSKRQSGTWDRLNSLDSPITRSTDNEYATSFDDYDDDNASILAESHWPRSRPGDSSEDEPTLAASADRNGTKSGGSRRKGFFRSLMKRLTRPSNRYGSIANTKEEQDRNVLQHNVLYEILDERLFLAPISKPKSILDVGTGPGIWALQTAGKYHAATVIGVDKDPINPPYTLRNCRLRTMDVSQDWDLDAKFDLIHVRMLGDFAEKEKLLQTCFDHLNPGGWVELTEWIVDLQSPNHSLDGTAFKKWNELLAEGLQNLGSSIEYPYAYLDVLAKTGFERVRITKNGGLTNPCYPGKQLQKVGTMMTQNWQAILEPLTMPVFVAGLQWTPESVLSLIKDVRKEIGDTRYHSFMTLLTIYARRPREGGTSSISASVSSASELTAEDRHETASSST